MGGAVPGPLDGVLGRFRKVAEIHVEPLYKADLQGITYVERGWGRTTFRGGAPRGSGEREAAVETAASASRDYLWEYGAIMLWEHVLGVIMLSDEPEEYTLFRRYAKLA